MTKQLLINSILTGSVYALVSFGFSIIYSTTKIFHFVYGALYAIAPYLAYYLHIRNGLPLSLSLLVSLGAVAALAAVIELAISRRFAKRGASSTIMMLVSIGLYTTIQNFISLVFGDDTKSFRGGAINAGIDLLGAKVTPVQLSTMAASIFILAICWLVVQHTQMGLAMRSVASQPELANVSGISSEKVFLWAFMLGSTLAGVTGLLAAFDNDMVPTMGMNALMMGVVAVIIGGVGSIAGAFLGAFLLAFAQNLGAWYFASQWQDTIAFAILLVFLVFRPQGFFGKKIRKAEV